MTADTFILVAEISQHISFLNHTGAPRYLVVFCNSGYID